MVQISHTWILSRSFGTFEYDSTAGVCERVSVCVKTTKIGRSNLIRQIQSESESHQNTLRARRIKVINGSLYCTKGGAQCRHGFVGLDGEGREWYSILEDKSS